MAINVLTRRRFLEAAMLGAAVPAIDVLAQERGDAATRQGGPGRAGAGTPESAPGGGFLPAGAPPPMPPGVTVERDVVYGKGGDMDMKVDIYKPPPGTEKRAATIHLHGGGFTGGSKNDYNQRGSIFPFAALGYVAIAAEYRLLNQAPWPAMLHDVKAAIRWTRANAARLNIDPARIILVGNSAGGYLALTATGTQNQKELEGTGGNAGAGTQIEECAVLYPLIDTTLPTPSVSPAMYVRANWPPTVILHGVADRTVPVESSQRFFQRLLDFRVPSEFHTFEGADHVYDVDHALAAASASLIDLFVTRQRAKVKT